MWTLLIVYLCTAAVIAEDTAECTAGQYQCFDGSCIEISGFCDFKNDCQDNSDELDCFKECQLHSDGYSYSGRRNITTSGSICQMWEAPPSHATSSFTYLVDAGNYCRNPDSETGPWCYVADPDIKWEFCQIPMCTLLGGDDTVNCTFDSGTCGWTQPPKSYGLWTRVKYWESSETDYAMVMNSSTNSTATLVSPVIRKTSSACFVMSYSFYGNGSFSLEVYTAGGTETKEPVWAEEMTVAATWNKAYVPLKRYEQFAIIIKGQTTIAKGPGGIVINDLMINDEECSVEGTCSATDVYHCKNKKCVDLNYLCDGYPDCEDKSDEENCYIECLTGYDKSGEFYGGKMNKTKNGHVCQKWDLYNNAGIIYEDGNYCRNRNGEQMPWCYTNETSQNQSETCDIPTCPSSYCNDDDTILCWNGLCMNKNASEEMRHYCYSGTFGNYSELSEPCPAGYECRESSICLNETRLCNGIPDCPHYDDEFICNITCPSNCECHSLVIRCNALTVPIAAIPKKVQVLDLSGTPFYTTNLQWWLPFLQTLNLSDTNLFVSFENMSFGVEMKLTKLQVLDLSFNKISSISRSTFRSLNQLKYLYLDYNHLSSIESHFFVDLVSLEYLSLSNSFILNISRNAFRNLNALKTLNISSNSISNIPVGTFYFLTSMSTLVLSNNFLRNVSGYLSAKLSRLDFLDLSFNYLSAIDIKVTYYLYILKLNNNQLESIPSDSLKYSYIMYELDLSFNRISFIDKDAFRYAYSMIALNLESNRLTSIPSKLFENMGSLPTLKLSSNRLVEIKKDTFLGLKALKTLYLQNNSIKVYQEIFDGLYNLEYLYTDSFTICCARPKSVSRENCFAPVEQISSCDHLVNNGFLSVSIWFIAVFALIGNMCVIAFRCKDKLQKGKHSPQLVFVLNLSFSDMLMGIYLSIISITDLYYRGIYGFNDESWRKSDLCTVAGILATISSESSAMFILLITIERVLVLKFPFTLRKLSVQISVACSVGAWIISLAIALFPLVAKDTFQNQFYSMSSVCISLPLTSERLKGWEYSVAVFIGFNFALFLGVIIGQIVIFQEVRHIGKKVNDLSRSREAAVAKSLVLVALSDSLCWLPIAIIGVIALSGVEVSSIVYSWVIVLVLPINSAINPFLYTFMAVKKRKRCVERRGETQDTFYVLDGNTECHRWVKLSSNVFTVPLEDYLRSNSVTTHDIYNTAVKLTEDLVFFHGKKMTHGHVSGKSVIISFIEKGDQKRVTQDNVFLTLTQRPISNVKDAKMDIKDLGVLMQRLIRSVHTDSPVSYNTKL